MGVSGCGKTTIGTALAAQLGCRFHDGDDYHPTANIAKMASGIPLNDKDRAGRLETLASIIRNSLEKGQNGVMACSALKRNTAGCCGPSGAGKICLLKGKLRSTLLPNATP